MTTLPITSLFAAIFAFALVALSVFVTLRRLQVGDMVGESLDETLRHRIRAQGNFTEYVPLGIIVQGLAETQAAPASLVVSVGGMLASGRLLHAIGMLRPSPALRGFGVILTYLSLVSAAAYLLVHIGPW